MHEFYEYPTLSLAPRSWAKASQAIPSAGARQVALKGGSFYALFRGQIGLASDEGIVMTVWSDIATAVQHGDGILDGSPSVRASDVRRLVATVRPSTPVAPTEPGIYAHRWFTLREANWSEFLELSESAWPGFEASYDTRILGLWRDLGTEPPIARTLLITRYTDLSVWERSRGGGVQTERESEVWRLFVRRHQLVESTVVITTQLAGPTRTEDGTHDA